MIYVCSYVFFLWPKKKERKEMCMPAKRSLIAKGEKNEGTLSEVGQRFGKACDVPPDAMNYRRGC